MKYTKFWTEEEHGEAPNVMLKNQESFKKKEGTREHSYVAQTAFHRNPKTCCAFLDLQKAYDLIWREALITKLEKQYRIPQSTVQLLEAMHDNALS